MRGLEKALAGLLLLTAALLMWGLVEPYTLDVRAYVVEVPHLPPAWDGARFAQLSDWQLGMWMANERTVRRSVAHVIDERPDFVLLTGDFVYHAGDDRADVVRRAAAIAALLPAAGIPTYAVLGNHDYGMKRRAGAADSALAARVAAALEAAGVDVLQNEGRRLARPAGSGPATPQDALYLVGIGANWPEMDRPEVALAGVPGDAARVVMMHNPNTFATVPAGAAPLAVAGHTHGGQISIPFTPDWSYLTFARNDVHADGWVEQPYGRPGNRLYVNRGIGFSTVPLRINCPPELTLFTLRRAPPAGAAQGERP